MKNIDMSTLSPEVAAYIRSLEETVLEQKMELVKLQSLTEQLVNLRKKMYGQSSEKVQYVSGEQLSMYQDFFYGMLSRNLLYTAISRAKKELILFGDMQALDIAVQKRLPQRKSMLVAKTRMLLEKCA